MKTTIRTSVGTLDIENTPGQRVKLTVKPLVFPAMSMTFSRNDAAAAALALAEVVQEIDAKP